MAAPGSSRSRWGTLLSPPSEAVHRAGETTLRVSVEHQPWAGPSKCVTGNRGLWFRIYKFTYSLKFIYNLKTHPPCAPAVILSKGSELPDADVSSQENKDNPRRPRVAALGP